MQVSRCMAFRKYNDFLTMRSITGSIVYFKGSPIAWKSSRQTVRSYSTCESEWIAASDSIILSEHTDFLDFFMPVSSPSETSGSSGKRSTVWVDSQAAIMAAQGSKERPKSRHLALRWHRVKDEAQRLAFCPTHLQRADALTKIDCSPNQRNMVLWNTKELSLVNDKSVEDEVEVEVEFCQALLSFQYYFE